MRLCAPPSPSAPRQQAAAQRSTNNACPLIFPSAPCNPPWGFPRLGETNVVPLTRPANLGLLLPPAPPPSRHTKTCSAHLPSPPLTERPLLGRPARWGAGGRRPAFMQQCVPRVFRRPPAPTTQHAATRSFHSPSHLPPRPCMCARAETLLFPPPPPTTSSPHASPYSERGRRLSFLSIRRRRRRSPLLAWRPVSLRNPFVWPLGSPRSVCSPLASKNPSPPRLHHHHIMRVCAATRGPLSSLSCPIATPFD